MYQKVSEKVEVGAQLSWSGTNSMRFGIATKFTAHPDATFRVSVTGGKGGSSATCDVMHVKFFITLYHGYKQPVSL